MAVILPDLAALIDPLLGLPYTQVDCWHLLRKVYGEGLGIDFDADPAAAIQHVQEIWFTGDALDPLALLQPWDVLILKTRGVASSHVGIVVNSMQFVHTGPRTGVCIAPIQRWKHYLLQLARLRQLC
jgi:cell wall-associated NlpC family hydrolase